MQNNLVTTIKAYYKLSPDELSNYVRKSDLSTELENYVKEAPTDGFTYGRRDKQWVELEASAVRNIRLRWGTSRNAVLNNDSIVSLENRKDLDTQYYKEGDDVFTYMPTVSVPEDSYVWLCCSRKIVGVKCEIGEGYLGPWDYKLVPGADTPDSSTVIGADGLPYYCYRTDSMLSAGHTWKLFVEIKVHKESD